MLWVLIVITWNGQSVNLTRFETEKQCEEMKVIITKTFDARTKLGTESKYAPAIACYRLTKG